MMAALDVEYNELSKRLRDLISQYSHFPEPILITQCKRLGKLPKDITRADLPLLSEYVRKAIGNFANPQRAEEAAQAVLRL